MDHDQLLRRLDEQGYVVVRGFLDRRTTSAIRAHIDGLTPPIAPREQTDAQRVFTLRHPIAGEIMPRLAGNPKLLDLAMLTLRTGATRDLLLLEQVLIRTDPKPPPHGPGEWHIDFAFLPEHNDSTPRRTYFHMVHACNTVVTGGGAFMIVPGSHRKTYAASAKIGTVDGLETLKNDPVGVAGINVSEGIEVCADEGDLIVFNPMCLHAPSHNSSDRPRYVYFASFMDRSATYLLDQMRKLKYRDNFPDSLRQGLPEELRAMLDR